LDGQRSTSCLTEEVDRGERSPLALEVGGEAVRVLVAEPDVLQVRRGAAPQDPAAQERHQPVVVVVVVYTWVKTHFCSRGLAVWRRNNQSRN